MALIDKDDFSAYVKWSANIPASEVDTHCSDAELFDIKPIMPKAKVSGNNIIEDITTAISESPVTKPELIALFNDNIKPLVVLKAYRRFLLWHGNNITQYGIGTNLTDTAEKISDKMRGELMGDADAKANGYLAEFKKALEDANYTFDNVVYQYSGSKPRTKTRIAAV